MIEYFRRLYIYDSWANAEVLNTFSAVAGPPSKCMTLAGHILSAERLWLERLQGQEQTLPVWPELTLERCKSQAAELGPAWKNYFAVLGEESLEDLVVYRNSKGESWSNRRSDILQHVIMHSAYHRGQIASQMRAAGLPPAQTDFIHAVRQKFV